MRCEKSVLIPNRMPVITGFKSILYPENCRMVFFVPKHIMIPKSANAYIIGSAEYGKRVGNVSYTHSFILLTNMHSKIIS